MLDLENFPRTAIFRGHKARITGYLGDDKFELLDKNDQVHIVHRSRFTFVKDKKVKRK